MKKRNLIKVNAIAMSIAMAAAAFTPIASATEEQPADYILFLPITEDSDYEYDESHVSEKYSTDNYIILLYQQGDTVQFKTNPNKTFTISDALDETSLVDVEETDDGEITFIMPDKDLAFTFVEEETETAAAAVQTQGTTEKVQTETPGETQTEASEAAKITITTENGVTATVNKFDGTTSEVKENTSVSFDDNIDYISISKDKIKDPTIEIEKDGEKMKDLSDFVINEGGTDNYWLFDLKNSLVADGSVYSITVSDGKTDDSQNQTDTETEESETSTGTKEPSDPESPAETDESETFSEGTETDESETSSEGTETDESETFSEGTETDESETSSEDTETDESESSSENSETDESENPVQPAESDESETPSETEEKDESESSEKVTESEESESETIKNEGTDPSENKDDTNIFYTQLSDSSHENNTIPESTEKVKEPETVVEQPTTEQPITEQPSQTEKVDIPSDEADDSDDIIPSVIDTDPATEQNNSIASDEGQLVWEDDNTSSEPEQTVKGEAIRGQTSRPDKETEKISSDTESGQAVKITGNETNTQSTAGQVETTSTAGGTINADPETPQITGLSIGTNSSNETDSSDGAGSSAAAPETPAISEESETGNETESETGAQTESETELTGSNEAETDRASLSGRTFICIENNYDGSRATARLKTGEKKEIGKKTSIAVDVVSITVEGEFGDKDPILAVTKNGETVDSSNIVIGAKILEDGNFFVTLKEDVLEKGDEYTLAIE